MQQVLVTFRDEASEAEVQAYLLAIRHWRQVARVELLSELERASIVRRPTADENPDITFRSDGTFFKGPSGALMAKLGPLEQDVVNLLTERRRDGKPPLTTRDELMTELRTANPRDWTSKTFTSATNAYQTAKRQLLGSEWELIDAETGKGKRARYGFKDQLA